MKIVADENMPLVQEFFGDLGRIVTRPGRSMTAADVADADILLVRSVTEVGPILLAGSQVRFVGTATIGTDHLDLPWLQSAGISVSAAPGCNARAVAEYVVATVLAARPEVDPAGLVLGIVGMGNVGRALARLAAVLGIRILACDPFVDVARLAAEGVVPPGVQAIEWSDLLQNADVICLHTPLTTAGPHPTRHMVRALELQRLRPGALLINAGRGAVIDNKALRAHLADKPGSLTAVLDVWEGEPRPEAALLEQVRFGTPHIAGYSQEGKWRGTAMVYEALCRFLGREPVHEFTDFVSEAGAGELVLPDDLPALDAVRLAVAAAYPVTRDDGALRQAVYESDPGAAFDRLRKQYWGRREFSAYKVRLRQGHAAAPMLAALGFQLVIEPR